MTVAYRNVQDLAEGIILDGGATTSLSLDDGPTTGYTVALQGCERQFALGDFGPVAILRYLADHFAALDTAGVYFGAWVAEAGEGDRDDTVYLDVAVNVADLATALELGRLNCQQAIWDVEAGKAIQL